MIKIVDKSKCCGCNACAQRCPTHCIKMVEDEEGFLYPSVDIYTCIECKICEKVCPVINPNNPSKPLKVFAAKNINENQRLKSSSGGFFILLAEHIIKQGGVVFGARFDKSWGVEHCYAETLEEIEPLMRSKYVQSRIGNTYKEAEHFLKQDRMVLYVGTSCQIAGLRKFLRKDYNNLVAVDFICHGVPSPGVWRNYLNEIVTEQNESAEKKSTLLSIQKNKSEICSINFREKQLGGYSWKRYGFVVRKSPSECDDNAVLLSDYFSRNIFIQAFLKNLILRPSCYECVAKNGAGDSDLTIADFWGIDQLHPDFDDDKGVSVVLIHTYKGLAIYESLSSKLVNIESNIHEATLSNLSYCMPPPMPRKRAYFWRLYFRTSNLSYSINETLKITIRDRIIESYNKIISRVKRFIARVI